MRDVQKATMSLSPGTEVRYADKRGHITHLLDFDSVLVKDVETGLPERVLIADLKPIGIEEKHTSATVLELVPDEDW